MKKLLIIFIFLLLIGCKEPVDGFIWTVESEETTLYILGSMHLGNRKLYPFSEKTEKLFEASDYLVVEKDMTQPVDLSDMYYGNDDLFNHLNDDYQKLIEDKCVDLDISLEGLRKKKIWAAGMTIAQLQLSESGLTGHYGVDRYYIKKAKKEKKLIIELEPIEKMLSLYNDLSDEEQIAAFLQFDDPEVAIESLNELYEGYLLNDLEKIESVLSVDLKDKQVIAMMDILATRHENMNNQLEQYLATDKTYFVVIGLQHLIGEESILTRLKENGYIIKRY